jgi:biotin transport system substrate-specific component
MAVNAIDRARIMRYNAFQWRCELSVVKKIALALGMACVTGLVAQLRIPLPWTPVPITGQTFAALLAGILLGQWWGGISMLIYAGLGTAGLPWFYGWSGGLSHLAGPTGGYIIGFILAAFFIGHFSDKYVKARKFTRMLGLMLAANFVLIYIPGLVQLYLWLHLVEGNAVSIYAALTMGLFPFIAGDIMKAIAAAATAWVVTPKQAFRKEVDRDTA